MKISWINKEDSTGAVTIYDNNITLSKQASTFFEDAFAVAIGIDGETSNLIIKHVSKEEAESPKTDRNSLHNISIKASYGRITGKKIVDEIAHVLKLDFSTQQNYKFNAKWNTGYKMLIVDTKGER